MEHQRRYSDPAFYTVTVAQKLSPDVTEILATYYYGNFVCKYQDQVTLIKGTVKDQVALSGLLIYLNDLHYVLLSVRMRK